MKHVNCDKLMVRLNGMEKMDGLLKGITEACLLVQKAAVGNCPVDMGELQGTITIVEPKPGREPAGIVGTNKEYAPYVELGTGLFAVNGDGRQDGPWKYQDAQGIWHWTAGNRAHPFIKPSIADHQGTYKNILKDELSKGG